MTVEEGNHGDQAINGWITAMLGVYHTITGKEPATSVRAPNNGGIAGGPLIRFLEAASRPLKFDPSKFKRSDDAWRSRVRTVLKDAPSQN